MLIGAAYADELTVEQRHMLQRAVDWLIEEGMRDLSELYPARRDRVDLAKIEQTVFSKHLPQRYMAKYNFTFLHKFYLCIITVAWKLGQPWRMRLSSVAEELAAWAILEKANQLYWDAQDLPPSEDEEDPFDGLIDTLFEDIDFKHLFTPSHDGIDETPLGTMLGMASLVFKDWFKPFVDDADADATYPTVYPYAMTAVESEDRETRSDDHDAEG